MRILLFSPRQVVFAEFGARVGGPELARALARLGDVTLLHFLEPGEPVPAPADLPFCRHIVSLPRPPLYTSGKLLRGVFGRLPLPAVNYYCPEMAAALGRLLAAHTFDVVHIESMNMAGYLPLLDALPRAPFRAQDWHNIDSEMMERYARSAPLGPRKLYAGFTARRLHTLESRLLASLDGHLVCSERERATLARRQPAARIAVIDNGVAVADFRIERAAALQRNTLVFVGQMSYPPNIEGALHFVRSLWPAIRQHFPQLRLLIVGANPAPAVRALAAEPNVEVTGTVPDVRPYYAQALAAVVPLLTGAGTRLKILEAMAAGVPVVSTPLGAEGLEVEPGEHILLASSPAHWLDALSQLCGCPDRAERLSLAARRLVEQRYDWEAIGARLAHHYRDWFATPRPLYNEGS